MSRSRIRHLQCGWLPNSTYQDGGSWALFAKNGHLVAEMARKGRSPATKALALQMAVDFNACTEERELEGGDE